MFSENKVVSLHQTLCVMGKNNKEVIFQKAFKTFVEKDFGSVTIQDIEDGSDFTRGALFYYTKDKISMFCMAIEMCFFEKLNTDRYLSDFMSKPHSLIEFVHFYVEQQEKRIKIFQTATGCRQSEAIRYYLRLMTSASDVMPGFLDRIRDDNDKFKAAFIQMISQAKDNGEIRPDTNVQEAVSDFILKSWGNCFNAVLSNDSAYDPLFEMISIYQKYKQS